MQTVLIVVHLMIVVALVGVVLLQRSEGGALGVGGGGGFMTGRGQANVLTRATAILAALFFLTSLALTLLANYGRGPSSILENGPPAPGQARPATPAAPLPPKGQGSVLDQLRQLEQRKAAQPAPEGARTSEGQTPSATPAPVTPPAAAAPSSAPAKPSGTNAPK